MQGCGKNIEKEKQPELLPPYMSIQYNYLFLNKTFLLVSSVVVFILLFLYIISLAVVEKWRTTSSMS